MPTSYVAVVVTEVTACDSDPARTLLLFSNPDTSAIIYVSDQQGSGLYGIPVPPQATIELSIFEGWDTTAKHYATSDTPGKYLLIGSGYANPWAQSRGEVPRKYPGVIN